MHSLSIFSGMATCRKVHHFSMFPPFVDNGFVTLSRLADVYDFIFC